jgi:excisionase family DNA binding protein
LGGPYGRHAAVDVTRHDEQPISLQVAADRLGVHYMTAYRYVRTGRLPAVRANGQWVIEPAAVRAFQAQSSAPAARSTRRARSTSGHVPARAIEGLVRALTQGDEASLWRQVEDQLAYGTEPEALYLDLLAPAMGRIGDAWASGALDVGEEHRASTVMHRVVGRLGPRFATRGRRRGTLVLGAPPREQHALPLSFLSDPLRGRHFDVVDLGADVPVESFAAAAARADRLVGVGLCATTGTERAIRATVKALRAAADVPIVLGGAAVADAGVAARLGADHYSGDGRDAIAIFESLAPGRR